MPRACRSSLNVDVGTCAAFVPEWAGCSLRLAGDGGVSHHASARPVSDRGDGWRYAVSYNGSRNAPMVPGMLGPVECLGLLSPLGGFHLLVSWGTECGHET